MNLSLTPGLAKLVSSCVEWGWGGYSAIPLAHTQKAPASQVSDVSQDKERFAAITNSTLGASNRLQVSPRYTLRGMGQVGLSMVDTLGSTLTVSTSISNQASGFTAAGKESRAAHRLALTCSSPDITYVTPSMVYQSKQVARTYLTLREHVLRRESATLVSTRPVHHSV